jgi:predicted nucleotide-binding protein (sugar kinase/HSP70/actin superfamily)
VAQSVELSYTDSCFPVKLLHGHAASLGHVDYVLYPCVVRMGLKEGDEDQKYACPLVQASPYIIREALGMGKRLLIPAFDFSRGDGDVINELTKVAVKSREGRRRSRVSMPCASLRLPRRSWAGS